MDVASGERPRGSVIILQPYELTLAKLVAQRRTEANQDVANAYVDIPDKNPLYDLYGALCEQAVAKTLNEYWNAGCWDRQEHEVNKNDIPDVGSDIEVRGIDNPWYKLIIRPNDIRKNRLMFLTYLMSRDLTFDSYRPVSVDVIGFGRAKRLQAYGFPFMGKGMISVEQKHLIPYRKGMHVRSLA
jgi:hypothetical protein